MSTTMSAVADLSGYAPAVPSPFDASGSLDTAAFSQFCERQVRHGAAALVVCGTTGEAPTLTRPEQATLVAAAVRAARGRVPVIAGAGSSSTAHAVALARDAAAEGADALLCVVPYYNRPTQAGLEAHFRAIAGSAALPIILYDVPSRTACGLTDATLLRLAELPEIVGLKDATGDLARPLRLRAVLGPRFRLLSGDDATAAAFIAQGGDGCISVTSNVAPGLCRRMHAALRQGRTDEALGLATAIGDLTRVLFKETNPVPVKFALSLMNLMAARVRLPLVELASGSKAEAAAVVARFCARYPDDMIGETVALKPVGHRHVAARDTLVLP